ncbi:hypothetical protein [Hyphomicrobium sp. MC1]|uniref:hypothetical protein n=1 Tax=Hyphomicrobium sp. (strain MC1) TaxID=717785 RepID=UPI000213E1AE|nr:hypothetical protein [Hyphomicrobium sp. MC1]CCB65230.1 protein of unknown function [Hyphomicrobium sp. MC1]
MPENSSDKPFHMFKITKEIAERHWGDMKFTEHDRSFYVACRDEPYSAGDLVVTLVSFGDGFMLGKVKRKHRYITVEVDDIEGALRFPHSDVLPVVGLQTSIF